jgi:Amt family ammonium transporter
VSVLWAVCTYSLAFHGTGKFIGNLDIAFMDHANTVPATGFGGIPIPPLSFSAFQTMFAVITPALITGAIADRMRFSSVHLVGGFAGSLLLCSVCSPIARSTPPSCTRASS